MRRFGVVLVLSVLAVVFSMGEAAEGGRRHRHKRDGWYGRYHKGHRHHHHRRYRHRRRIFHNAFWYSPTIIYRHDSHHHHARLHPNAYCSYSHGLDHEELLTLVGAVGGAAVGYQIGEGGGRALAMFLGTLIGVGVGSSVGRDLDEASRLRLAHTTQYALERQRSGTPTTWNDPDRHSCGVVVPKPAFQNEIGQYCREFQQTVVIDGRKESAYGTACRQPDGQWRLVN